LWLAGGSEADQTIRNRKGPGDATFSRPMPENHAHLVPDLSIWGGHYCEQVLSLSAPLSAKDLDRALWPFLTLPRFFYVILPLATTGWFDIMRQSWLERHRTNQGG